MHLPLKIWSVFATQLCIPFMNCFCLNCMSLRKQVTMSKCPEPARVMFCAPVIWFGGTRNEITPDFRLVASRILDNLRKQFGLRILQIRRDLAKSQEDFAEMIGMSVDFLSLIERGRNAPSFKKLERMARALSVPVAYLFTFDSNTAPRGRKTVRRKRRAH
jgi:DNA-binding XRE family transcriptional regulator